MTLLSTLPYSPYIGKPGIPEWWKCKLFSTLCELKKLFNLVLPSNCFSKIVNFTSCLCRLGPKTLGIPLLIFSLQYTGLQIPANLICTPLHKHMHLYLSLHFSRTCGLCVPSLCSSVWNLSSGRRLRRL